MARNGTGAFLRVHNWTADADAAINIRADRMDEEFDGMAAALTFSIAKDGQTVPTANLPMGGFKITGAGVATGATDYLTLGQAQSQAVPGYPVFYAQNSVDQTVTGGALTEVDFAAVLDPGGDFATNAYTAPVTGSYEFTAALSCIGTTITTVRVELYKNGSPFHRLALYTGALATLFVTGAAFAELTAGDVITVRAQVDGTGTLSIEGTGSTPAQFGGRLIAS